MSAAAIFLNDVPPSMNTNTVRSHWRGFHTEKKRWQNSIEFLLVAESVPRPIPAIGPVGAHAILRFPDRRRRDSENFRPVLSKALGDALVNGGWLPDDTDAYWWLRVTIDPETGPRRTLIELSWTTSVSLKAAA